MAFGTNVLWGRAAVYMEVAQARLATHASHGSTSVECLAAQDRLWQQVYTFLAEDIVGTLTSIELQNVGLPALPGAHEQLRKELIAMAALACAWIDALDRDDEATDLT